MDTKPSGFSVTTNKQTGIILKSDFTQLDSQMDFADAGPNIFKYGGYVFIKPANPFYKILHVLQSQFNGSNFKVKFLNQYIQMDWNNSSSLYVCYVVLNVV